ncbi:hypothetical protein TNCV_2866901 [Trichonephila clavipes]|nr:hypothetical protein TNCV_2866901 [Trichonephila clavipes]
MAFLGKAKKKDLVLLAEELGQKQIRWESELNQLRLEIESIRSNVRRTSCVEDRKKTSSNYRISIGRAEEHVRETSPAVLMAEATIPTIPIKEEKGMDDLRCQGQGHGVVPVPKNLVNDMLICSSDYEGLIEISQMVRNPAILREPSKEEGIINSVNSKSVCSQEMVTDILPETYTQSLLNVLNGNLFAVKINGSNVQTNGQGIKESKREVAFTCVFKNRILYSNRRGRLQADFFDQSARKVNVWHISGRGIRILNRFPIIPGTLPDNAGQPYFRPIVAGAYLKSHGARKLGP